MKKIPIKQNIETCTLLDSGLKVKSLIQDFSFQVYEVEVAYEGYSAKQNIEFLCESGSSGLPGADVCEPATLKRSVRYFVK